MCALCGSGWGRPLYRRKSAATYVQLQKSHPTSPIYPEHNQNYCIEYEENLKCKGIQI